MGRTKRTVNPDQQPFLAHLIELRDRLLNIVKVVAVIFIVLMPFANALYATLAEPLIATLPEGSTMIATEVASPFLAPFKFALVFAVFLAMPFILYQMWAFVAPGLYAKERKIIFPLLVSSSLLFYLGIAFAYFVVFPVAFGFLMNSAPEGVAVMTDISRYLDFVLKMFFAFGIAFEVPVATFIVVKAGMVSADDLAKKRPYVIVGAFIFGMLFTPPDAVSQTLLAIPMWILFELGLLAARRYIPEEGEASSASSAADAEKKP